ncbi:DNA methylase [Arthrobacter phage Shoya]|uniref:DNA (cytosine-5-)-methyltransferase n=1 Tax=Arthrobacter phage Shoya TaxID=2704035 RepID=A0A6G6XIZ2_9CAUD|nr:DNA methylase [Arthrobacter phage Shoya]QIG57730.1 DNA methylase [Arthrobacter phage Shoya]
MSLTMTDMFCGAGGSSTGATMLPGISVRTALNHWDKALESHNANHPDTVHVQADIKETDPRYIATSDILWASPECTNHSVAKGRKRVTNQADLFGDTLPDEAADRSRATMWDVPRFAEVHRYRAIITENVVDAAKWIMFDAWLMAMKSLGYEHRIQYLNSMHAQHGGLPAPQSRDRMYVLFWLKGNQAPDVEKYFRPKAYCGSCDEIVDALQVFKKSEQWGRYRAQYVYRCPKVSCKNAIVEPGWLPASHAIDWSLRGERIGDRKRPLAPKTVARIEAGLAKYGKEPVSIDSVRGSQILSAVNREPFQTQTTAYTRSLLVPVEGREGKQAQAAGEPMRTQTTRNETGLLTSPRDHMLMEYYGNGQMHPTSKAIPTITTHDRFAMITTLRGTNAPKDVGQPLDTFAANGLHHGLAEWKVPAIEDCEFRMLEPHEIKAGMAFPKEYIMLGNKREQVKMAGNAVTPPAARDLVACMAETLQAY